MNLFICFTPLQILICEKIIENYHNEEFELLLICNYNNKKLPFYANRMKPKAKNIFKTRVYQADIYKNLNCLLKIKSMLKGKNYINVFTPQPKGLFIATVLNNVTYRNLYSFDDGIANLHYEGNFLYGKLVKLRLINKIKKQIKYLLLGIKPDDFENYTSILKAHYTIFPNMPNLIKNTKEIKLFNENFSDKQDRTKTIKLFLGQPIYEKELEKNRILIEGLIEKFKIDLYLPHPREEYIIKNVKYIDTKLIAEDYIISQLQKDKTINFEIYGFFTTALFTLSNLNILKLNAISMQNDEVFENVKSLYNIMQKLNIKVINL
ncbi:glycosyltransferase family 52 [Campylobacter ureolyticus]|uniref:glycosyltransferase family 52 n=1 Tax=Campylobacter ureolyticus TaxID=827 RepID=UPI002906A9A5|nr:glycosyltransferase family 52 [Campylobacter ureolyticus]MDU5325674.1 glycosyltransferase family 52 [Campylobacter ureolyticus]